MTGRSVHLMLLRLNGHGVRDLLRLNTNHQHFHRRLHPIAIKPRGIEMQIHIGSDDHVDCDPFGANHSMLAERGSDASLLVHKLRSWATLVIKWQFSEHLNCCHGHLLTMCC